MENALNDLQLAESEVCEIMKTAEETMKELQNLPRCDGEKLAALSNKYMELIQSVYDRVTVYSKIMHQTNENNEDIYSQEKEKEIFESLMKISETSDQPL
jgi:Zn-finger nucleic acid-binding protein